MDSSTGTDARRSKPPPLNINLLVQQYLALRDKKNELERQHKAMLEPFNKLMDQISAIVLSQLQAANVDSMSTPSGTAYRATRLSAVIRDGDAFRQFVIGHGFFELVDWRANANAVFDWIKEHEGESPPGIHASSFTRLNVRRPDEE